MELNLWSKRGVELFFVISGFILGLPFARHYIYGDAPIRLKKYFLRRLTRLEPPYIINLLFCFAVLVGAHQMKFGFAIPHLLASMFYLHTLVYGYMSSINGVSWSLEVEVQFYCLVPIITTIYGIGNTWTRRATLLSCILISSIWGLYFTGHRFHGTVLYYLPYFLAGLLCADFHLSWVKKEKHIAWDLVSVVCWTLMWMMSQQQTHLFLPPLLMVLVISTFRSHICSRFFSMKWITAIGGMCYTIYLYHYVLISSIGRVLKRVHIGNNFGAYYVLQASIMLPIVLVICVVLFVTIERPCMDHHWPSELRGRFWRDPGKNMLEPDPSRNS